MWSYLAHRAVMCNRRKKKMVMMYYLTPNISALFHEVKPPILSAL